MIRTNSYLAIALIILICYSCSSSEGNRVVTDSKEEATTLFELDSIATDDEKSEAKKGKEYNNFQSSLDLKEFSNGILLGSMLYADNYDIDVIQLAYKDSAYLILSEFRSRDNSGNVFWELVDSLKIHFPEGATIGWPGYVMENGTINSEILALLPEDADWINTEIYYNVLGAWRFDRKNKKIIPVATDSISCINESYGVD